MPGYSPSIAVESCARKIAGKAEMFGGIAAGFDDEDDDGGDNGDDWSRFAS